MTYTRKSELDSDSIARGIEPEFCEVQVNILKITGDENKAVEFTKIAGSTRLFDK